MKPVPAYRAETMGDSMSIRAASKTGDGPVHWASLNSLKTPTQTMDRVIAWTAEHLDAPHLVMERGSFEGREAIATMTLLPRADLVLDRTYLETYYGGAYDRVVNECSKRPSWRRYTPNRLDAKPMLAHSVCYTFPDTPDEDAFYTKKATQIVKWWMGCVEKSQRENSGLEKRIAYDQRYRQGIIDDGDVSLVTSMFGADAASAMIEMTIGIIM